MRGRTARPGMQYDRAHERAPRYARGIFALAAGGAPAKYAHQHHAGGFPAQRHAPPHFYDTGHQLATALVEKYNARHFNARPPYAARQAMSRDTLSLPSDI